jgi:hypothetical protein
MWQHFLTLPLVARVIAYAGVGILALWGIIKAKAIHATVKKATDTASAWFWARLRQKINSGHPQQPATNERTYKGVFDNYAYSSTPYPVYLLQITSNGVTMTVGVEVTPLVAGIKPGTFVEIDTETRSGYTKEFVKRVRLLTKIS